MFYGMRCSVSPQRPGIRNSGGDKPLPYDGIDAMLRFVGEGFIPSPPSTTYLSDNPCAHRTNNLFKPVLELLFER